MNEEWRPCLDGFYEVSSLGRVRRVSTGRALSLSATGNGYLKVAVCVRGREMTRTVHRLVAEGFHGPANGLQVNHIDGDKRNNAPSNLEYVTAAQNSAHAATTGLAPSGSRHGRYTSPARTARGVRVNTARMSERLVREARRLRAAGWTLPRLCERYSLSKSAMHQITTRKSWRHVQ